MATTAELVARISADTRQLQRELRRSGGHLDKFEKKGKKSAKAVSTSFTGLGTVLATVAAVLTGRLVKGLVGTITTFEKLEASLKTVTGSAEAAAFAFSQIQDFAATTPFQLEEVVAGFIKLKALGLDPSEEALRSYGNTASAMGKSLNQMVEAIADAATGEFERLKEFGIKARSQGDEVTFTFQGVATTVKKSASDIEGFLRTIGDVNFAGAMEEQANTLNVSLSNLEDSFSKLAKAIGDAGITALIKGIVDSLRDMVDVITIQIPLAVQKLEVVKNVLADISIGSSTLGEDMSKIGSAFSHVFGDVAAKLKETLTGVKEVTAAIAIGGDETVQTLAGKIAAGWQQVEDAAAKAAAASALAGQAALDAGLVSGGDEEEASLKALGGADKMEEELQALDDHFLSREELELAHHTRRIAQIQEFLDTEANITLAQKARLEQLQEAHKRTMEAKDKAAKDKKLSDQQKSFKNLIAQAAGANKTFFQLNKVRAISEAVLSAGEAVQGAYAVGAKIGGPALGAAFAATAAAATAANIAAIASTTYGGGGSSSGGGGAGGATPISSVNELGQPVNLSTSAARGADVNITLNGTGFSDEDVRDLIGRINDNISDNVRIN